MFQRKLLAGSLGIGWNEQTKLIKFSPFFKKDIFLWVGEFNEFCCAAK